MRILHLVQSFLPRLGGLEWVVHHLANALAGRGHDVTVLTSRAPCDDVLPDLSAFNFRYRPMTYPFGLRGGELLGRNRRSVLSAIIDARGRNSFDLIHAHNHYYPGYCAHLMWRRTGLPYVVTDHGQLFRMIYGDDVPRSRRVRKMILRAATLAPVQTSPGPEADEVLRRFAPPGAAILLQNGIAVPLPEVMDALRNQERTDAPLILMVGRHHPVKGFELGLRAFAQLVHQRPQCRLRLVGHGVQNLEPLAVGLGIRNVVELLPAVSGDALWRHYAAAACFWLPSHSETQGLTKYEALCFSLPCVCNDAPGTRNDIRHGENGLLFKANDPADLAAWTLKLLDDPSARAAIGARAKATGDSLRWENMVGHYESLYLETIRRFTGVSRP